MNQEADSLERQAFLKTKIMKEEVKKPDRNIEMMKLKSYTNFVTGLKTYWSHNKNYYESRVEENGFQKVYCFPKEIVENGSDWELIDERIYLALNSNAGWEYYSSCELTKDQLNIMEKALNNEIQPGWSDEDMIDFGRYVANNFHAGIENCFRVWKQSKKGENKK